VHSSYDANFEVSQSTGEVFFLQIPQRLAFPITQDKISSFFLTTAFIKIFSRRICSIFVVTFVECLPLLVERVSFDDDANKLVNCISLLAAALLGFGADLLWAVECVHHADDEMKKGDCARCGDQILSLLSSTFIHQAD
jgi:hypothetical protein